jgi:hypothetical protein
MPMWGFEKCGLVVTFVAANRFRRPCADERPPPSILRKDRAPATPKGGRLPSERVADFRALACCDAWNWLIAYTARVSSITTLKLGIGQDLRSLA